MVDLRQVDTLVIDEADRMLDMGFIPDVRAIVNRLPDRDHRCTMLYSATLNDTVMNLAAMWMRDPVRVEIESDKPATDTVKQIVYIARSEEKFTLLYNHLARNPEARTLIFCNRKFTTERLAENLRRRGIDCEVLSGDVNQSKRLRILEAFRAGKIRIVVATDVAGRGIHVDDIAYVVNYDFPYEPAPATPAPPSPSPTRTRASSSPTSSSTSTSPSSAPCPRSGCSPSRPPPRPAVVAATARSRPTSPRPPRPKAPPRTLRCRMRLSVRLPCLRLP